MRSSDWSSDVCSSDRGAKVETIEGGGMTSEIYENVWDALADTEQEAANLKLRSSFLYEIRKVVQGWNVSQDEAGKRHEHGARFLSCRHSRPRPMPFVAATRSLGRAGLFSLSVLRASKPTADFFADLIDRKSTRLNSSH